MKILCTGSAGYIASAVIPKLLNNGYEVKGVDLEPSNNSDIEHIVGDIRDLDLMGKLVKGIDAVVHLAAVVPTHSTLEDQMDNINFKGTCNLGTICRIKGVRTFLYASSCSVYGVGADLDEASILKKGKTTHAPDTPYACGKIKSENFLLSLRNNSFNPVIMRFATAFGCANKMSWLPLVNLFVKCSVERHKLEIKYRDSYRPFCHVDDIASGIVLLLNKSGNINDNHIFNVGGFNATKNELAHLITNLIPEVELVDLGGKDIGYSVNFNKISKLGFTINKNLSDGIKEIKEILSK